MYEVLAITGITGKSGQAFARELSKNAGKIKDNIFLYPNFLYHLL